jgi:RTX calcium-binding nonapeptide repeat (4 copies)
VLEGNEGSDRVIGTPEDDIIDSKGSADVNYGDTILGSRSGNHHTVSGDRNARNVGDTVEGEGSGDDVLTGRPCADVFSLVKRRTQSQTITHMKEM